MSGWTRVTGEPMLSDAWDALFGGRDDGGVELLDFRGVAEMLSSGGVKVSAWRIEENRRQGRGPRFVRLGARYVTTRGEVLRWLAEEFEA